MDKLRRQPWLFMSDSRIGRLRYFAYSVTVTLLNLPAIGLSVWLLLHGHPITGMLVSIASSLIANVFNYAFTYRRLHDLNLSGWWALILIPEFIAAFLYHLGWRPHGLLLVVFICAIIAICGYALILIFAPGTTGENRFGPPPPPNSVWVVIGTVAGISLPFVACTAAIMIPAYQVKLIRLEAADGVRVGFTAQHAVMDYVSTHQNWPKELNLAYSVDTQSLGKYVSGIRMPACGGNICRLIVMFDDGNSHRRIRNTTLEIWTEDEGSTWSCGPGGYNPIPVTYLPQTCRDKGAP